MKKETMNCRRNIELADYIKIAEFSKKKGEWKGI